jgi:hypothetical protein
MRSKTNFYYLVFRPSTSSSSQPQPSTSGFSHSAISEDEDVDDPIEVYGISSSSLP